MNRFAKLLAAATFVLIVAGGLVTSTGSGLSVPDWPLSYGRFFPPMIGGIRFEHSHRVIAGFVGILTLLFTLFLFKAEKRAWVRRLGLAALLAVIAQAILGGITVLALLPTAVSVAHACLAQAFFCLVVSLVLFTGREWEDSAAVPYEGSRSLQRLLTTTAVFLCLQLIAGAVLRHSAKSGVHIHLFLAFLIVVHVFLAIMKIAREPLLQRKFFRAAVGLGGLVIAQIFLGFGAFIVTRMLGEENVSMPIRTLLATAHQANGALILAACLWLTLSAFRFLKDPAGRKPFSNGKEAEAKKNSPSLYLELTKPRLTLMALLTTLLGFVMACHPLRWGPLFHTLFGALLIGGGANALNQFLEKDVDALMKRTETRPIPSGRIPEKHVLWFGALLSCAGLLHLLFFANLLTAGLGALTLFSYVLLYTPLKRLTPLNTLVGAVSGALPSVIGWTGAQNRLEPAAGALFFILFLWQLPHFLAISWVYRDDYLRSGLRMAVLKNTDAEDTAWRIAWQCLILLFVSFLPAFLGIAGPVYFLTVLFSGALFTAFSLCLVFQKMAHAKKFVSASIVYLLVLVLFMMADKI